MKERARIIKRIVLEAGKLVRAADPSGGVMEKVGRANIVTAADLASERVIVEGIRRNFEGDLILSEETEADLGDVLSLERLWVIDPIDGTNNFRHKRGFSCVSVGYVEKGVVKLGAAYDMFRRELFFAARGRGAYLNGQRMFVGQQSELAGATVSTDNPYSPAGTRRNLELFLRIQNSPWLQMRGSAVLGMAEVACGRSDLYFHTFTCPWDNAAAFLFVEEAGGIVRGLDGREVTFMDSEIVVGNRAMVEQFVKEINYKGN